MINYICNFLIKYHQKFIYLFFVLYFFIFIIIVSSFYLPIISRFSKLFGQLSLLTYIITLVPGMALRFGLNYPIFTVLRLYRRHFGISMFLFALTHMVLSGLIFSTSFRIVVSTIALIILFFLFITSNNISQKMLSKNWFLLQKLTYVTMFLIFIHVALLDFGALSLLFLAVIILQIISFLYPKLI